MKLKVYYAHPLNTYNTKIEFTDMTTLGKLFGDENIINPNSPKYDRAYKASYDMEVFFSTVRECNVLAFRGTPSGKISAGVAAEIKVAQEVGAMIIELPSLIGRNMSIEDTRQYLREVGYR